MKKQKKSQYKLWLVNIIELVGIPFVINILFGRFLKILSNSRHNYTNERNLVLDVTIDLAKDLISTRSNSNYPYFYNKDNYF